MYSFSKRSLGYLYTCHEDLIRLFSEAIKTAPIDISIISGYRGSKEQNRLQAEGSSELVYPRSMHNKKPSLAVDVIPYPIDYSKIERYRILSYHIKIVAWKLGIEVNWGGDWKNFKDFPHWQLDRINYGHS